MSSKVLVTYESLRVVCPHCGHDHEDGIEFEFEHGTGYAECAGCSAILTAVDDA